MNRMIVVTNQSGDWRRIYVDGDLVAEGRPERVKPNSMLEGVSVEYVTVDDFDLLGESGGEAVG